MTTTLIAAALLVLTITFAQSNKEDVGFFQAIYGKKRMMSLPVFIKLECRQKDAFWKLYDEYETQRSVMS